jgi:RNA polymerase sigma-70 factor (ECF subfamily)
MIDVLRRERRVRAREVASDELPEPQTISPRDERDKVDFGRVKAAIEALPERQREIVSALKLRDESVKEVSTRMGMSPSAVKVTAHRAYRALRRALGGGDRED